VLQFCNPETCIKYGKGGVNYEESGIPQNCTLVTSAYSFGFAYLQDEIPKKRNGD